MTAARVFFILLAMGRPLRVDLGNYVYHVLNRANGRAPLFLKDGDYQAFLRIMTEALEHVPGMRLLGYCLMPNHWHMVLWPKADGELADYLHWLTLTHTQRWHAHHHDSGMGHLYQGRYKSFPVAEDEHYFTMLRYVERNALRAGLVSRAEAWPWGSLARRIVAKRAPRVLAASGEEANEGPLVSDGPIALPGHWQRHVNEAQSEAEVAALRRCVQRGQPFGSEAWTKKTAAKLNLQSTLAPRGRPRKERGAGEQKGS